MMKKMEKIPEKNPFMVPDGYFEEVNKKIISATSGKDHANSRYGSSLRLRSYLLAAASIAGFILLSYTVIKLIAPLIINARQSEVLTEDYLYPYVNDLDIYSLEENAESFTIPVPGPDVSNAEIIEYLVQENIEINDIYEQL
jgi:hypothetical protein